MVDAIKWGTLSLGACLVLGCVTKAEFQPYQESVQKLEAQTKRIEKQLTGLDQEVKGDLESIRQAQADMKADLIDVLTEMQQLRGDLSSGQHKREMEGQQRQSVEESVALQLSYLQEQMQASEARLARIEGYFGLKPPKESSIPKTPGAQGPSEPPRQGPGPEPPATGGVGEQAGVSTAPAPAAPAEELSAEEAYEMAYHLFQTNQNEASRKAFEQFVHLYPESSLVDNALFWIGETHYRAGQYEDAILKYQQVVKQYPKGSKGPDALLKMGYALEKMNEPEAAVAAMEKLLKAYPKSPQATLAARKIEQLKSAATGSKKDQGNEAKQKPEKPAKESKPPEKTSPPKTPS
jgi:tol-pal system protein YbgF